MGWSVSPKAATYYSDSNMYNSGGLIHMADIKHPNVHYTKLLSDGSKMSTSVFSINFLTDASKGHSVLICTRVFYELEWHQG